MVEREKGRGMEKRDRRETIQREKLQIQKGRRERSGAEGGRIRLLRRSR